MRRRASRSVNGGWPTPSIHSPRQWIASRPSRRRIKNRNKETVMPDPKIMEVGNVQVDLDLTIQAAPARVWKALLEQTALWWPKTFYATRAPKHVSIEPWPGGRMLEEPQAGGGLLSYT